MTSARDPAPARPGVARNAAGPRRPAAGPTPGPNASVRPDRRVVQERLAQLGHVLPLLPAPKSQATFHVRAK